ncbi:MAG: DUF4365 domain-containing protein [Deltaproteobacteria bacterium]|nr:DUF4365 domain-containing protein [Deltaproteobacteria bacterium]
MKYPKRPPTHIKETESWKILQHSVPSEWMVRGVSERDYGIDCYIEMVGRDGSVRGDLLSIQLKGTESLNWVHNEKQKRQETKFSGIKIETINYWMNLAVPVFLCIAETSTKRLYFAPVKQQVRNQYKKYKNQQSLSFLLRTDHRLDDENGLLKFIICYIQEKNFKELTELSRLLLIHLPQYYGFIIENQELDPFLGVEPDDELMFVHIYLTLHNLCNLLAIDWDIKWLSDIFHEDKETWKDSYYNLHNLTFTKLMPQLNNKLVEVLTSIKKIMTEYQSDFWETKQYIIYQKAIELDVSNLDSLIF